jgi:hypothetical protein
MNERQPTVPFDQRLDLRQLLQRLQDASRRAAGERLGLAFLLESRRRLRDRVMCARGSTGLVGAALMS